MPQVKKTLVKNKTIARPQGHVLAHLNQGGDVATSNFPLRLALIKLAFFVWVIAALLVFFAAGYFAGKDSVQSAAGIPMAGSPLQALQGQSFESSVNIVSVTSSGVGSLNQATVEVVPGNGKVLFSINPFVEPDTQNSMRIAVSVAQHFTGKSLSDRDVIVGVENTPAKLVGGPSAGAAIAVATIAAIQGKKVRGDAAITGTIRSDGGIGQVGGIIEKALAAADQNLSLFVVPKGQKVITIYERVQQREDLPGFTIFRTRYVPKTIDLQGALEQDGYKTRVVEAERVEDAVALMVENS